MNHSRLNTVHKAQYTRHSPLSRVYKTQPIKHSPQNTAHKSQPTKHNPQNTVHKKTSHKHSKKKTTHSVHPQIIAHMQNTAHKIQSTKPGTQNTSHVTNYTKHSTQTTTYSRSLRWRLTLEIPCLTIEVNLIFARMHILLFTAFSIGGDTSTRGRSDSVKKYQRNSGDQRITRGRGSFNKTNRRFVGRAEKEELYTCKQRRK